MIPTLNCYRCDLASTFQIDLPCQQFTVNPFNQTCGTLVGYPNALVRHFKFPGSENTIYPTPISVIGLVQTAILTGDTFSNGFFSVDPATVNGSIMQIAAFSDKWHYYYLNKRPTPNTSLLYPLDYGATIPVKGGSCVYIRFQSGSSQIWNAFGIPDCNAYPDVCAIRPPRETYQPPNAVPPTSTNNTIFTGQFIRVAFDTSIVLGDP